MTTLKAPFIITPSLNIGLAIGSGYLELVDGEFQINDGLLSYPIADFKAGIGDTQSQFEAVLSFMDAACEARTFRLRTGRKSENENLFPENIVDWIVENMEDVQLNHYELQMNPNLIGD